MSFRLNTEHALPVIEIQGKFLGSLEGAPFVAMLNDLKAQGDVRAVIDLSKADFIDSSGIGVFIESVKNVRHVGGDLRLAALQKRVKGVFLMSKLLGPVFRSYETTDAALESFTDELEMTNDG